MIIVDCLSLVIVEQGNEKTKIVRHLPHFGTGVEQAGRFTYELKQRGGRIDQRVSKQREERYIRHCFGNILSDYMVLDSRSCQSSQSRITNQDLLEMEMKSADSSEMHDGTHDITVLDGTSSTFISHIDADWFLEIFESSFEAGLSTETKELLHESDLRKFKKHRRSVSVDEDFRFIQESTREPELEIVKRLKIEKNSYNGAETGKRFARRRLSDDINVGREIVKEACWAIVRIYAASSRSWQHKIGGNGCIWSAFMYRAEYFLRKRGVECEIRRGEDRNKETTLYVKIQALVRGQSAQEYRISRSNLRKLILECQAEQDDRKRSNSISTTDVTVASKGQKKVKVPRVSEPAPLTPVPEWGPRHDAKRFKTESSSAELQRKLRPLPDVQHFFGQGYDDYGTFTGVSLWNDLQNDDIQADSAVAKGA